MSYSRVPPLGGDRVAELRRDPFEVRAAENARKLDALEAKRTVDDFDRYTVDAILQRPLSDTNRARAEALKDKWGLPAGQRALIRGGQQQGGQQQAQGQGSGQRRSKTSAAYNAGADLAKALQDYRDGIADGLD